MEYKEKYLKYKSKYLSLKGGSAKLAPGQPRPEEVWPGTQMWVKKYTCGGAGQGLGYRCRGPCPMGCDWTHKRYNKHNNKTQTWSECFGFFDELDWAKENNEEYYMQVKNNKLEINLLFDICLKSIVEKDERFERTTKKEKKEIKKKLIEHIGLEGIDEQLVRFQNIYNGTVEKPKMIRDIDREKIQKMIKYLNSFKPSSQTGCSIM